MLRSSSIVAFALVAVQGQAAVGDTASHSFDYRLLPLESAYSHYQPDWPGATLASATPLPPGAGRGRSEPAYTTWKHRPPVELCRVIDYIWFTSGPSSAFETPVAALQTDTATPPTHTHTHTHAHRPSPVPVSLFVPCPRVCVSCPVPVFAFRALSPCLRFVPCPRVCVRPLSPCLCSCPVPVFVRSLIFRCVVRGSALGTAGTRRTAADAAPVRVVSV